MTPPSRVPAALVILAALLPLAGCGGGEAPATAHRWWKGNLHTHSLWSDGDDYPEAVVAWYRPRGYHFLAISDHNVMAREERWIDVAASAGGTEAFQRYLAEFGDEWVESRRDSAGALQARLRRFDEYRSLFERPDTFLLMESEEISDRFEARPIHVNATNLREPIPPQGGSSVAEVMQNNVDAVLEQRRRTGQAMIPHINHPNFGWAVTAEDLIALEGEKFFEVYNGHPAVHNDGDDLHPGTERLWDIILAERLRQGRDVMYGIGVDDAHHYLGSDTSLANPGRAWIVVRAPALRPDDLIAAMEAGDFYASTGVVLEDVRVAGDALEIAIAGEPGVTYRTEFIGTRAGYDATATPVQDADGVHVTRRYSEEIGSVLADVSGTAPAYRFAGDELYVRARVTSSRTAPHATRTGEAQRAWTQPIVVRR